MLADQLAKAWRERRGSVAIDADMRFSDEGRSRWENRTLHTVR